VAVSSLEGIFAIGDNGAICHVKDSGTGNPLPVAAFQAEWEELAFTMQYLRGATVNNAGAVFFAGDDGTIIRYGR
jgi:hypothetical protein